MNRREYYNFHATGHGPKNTYDFRLLSITELWIWQNPDDLCQSICQILSQVTAMKGKNTRRMDNGGQDHLGRSVGGVATHQNLRAGRDISLRDHTIEGTPTGRRSDFT